MDKKLRIIMAEDDPVNQKVTLLTLKKLGLRAEAAANGIEATKIIRQRWPNGPKIIVITDCDSNTFRELCFDAGANEFLSKPVMVDELTAAIERSEPVICASCSEL